MVLHIIVIMSSLSKASLGSSVVRLPLCRWCLKAAISWLCLKWTQQHPPRRLLGHRLSQWGVESVHPTDRILRRWYLLYLWYPIRTLVRPIGKKCSGELPEGAFSDACRTTWNFKVKRINVVSGRNVASCMPPRGYEILSIVSTGGDAPYRRRKRIQQSES